MGFKAGGVKVEDESAPVNVDGIEIGTRLEMGDTREGDFACEGSAFSPKIEVPGIDEVREDALEVSEENGVDIEDLRARPV